MIINNWLKYINSQYDGCMLKIELFFHKNVQRSGKCLQMMTYSAGFSNSYRVSMTFECTRMLNGKTSTSSCTYKFSEIYSEFWLLFVPRRGAYNFMMCP